MRHKAVFPGLLAAAFVIGACERGPEPTSRELLGEGVFLTLDGGSVTLSGGSGIGDGNVRHELLMAAEGDLDFDSGTDAAAVLVAEQGRERFLTLHALVRDGGEPVDVSARLIGDRIEVRRMAIEDGLIRLDVRIRRPGEPITVPPSVDIVRHFVLTNRGVIPIRLTDVVEEWTRGTTPAAEGARDGAMVGPALHTHEWELESADIGDWTADLRGVEPVTLRFLAEAFGEADVSGQVSGFAGCNQVFGSFRATGSEALRFYGLATTRRSCRGRGAEVEQRLREALGSVRAFQLSGDRLVLALIDGAIRFRAGGRLVPVTPESSATGQAGDG